MSTTTEESRRQKADNQRFASYVFILLLSVLFALQWGPGSRGCDNLAPAAQEQAAATVNGKEITARQFANAYDGYVRQFQGQGLSRDMMKQFGFHKQALDQLVLRELLQQTAEARGIVASDQEVAQAIFKDPSFQKNGAFSEKEYHDIVTRYLNMTPQAYEAKLRRDLSAQKLLALVDASAVVSDDEVKARYQKEGNTAKVSFVKFSAAMFSGKVGVPKPAEVEAWAKANDAAIAAHYEQNKFTFFQPEQVRARQILLRYAPDATPAQKAEVKQKAENLRKEIVDNKKDFSQMAKDFSEDPTTKEKGGDLGFVERMGLAPQFGDVLFALKPGEVSVAVETPIGVYLGQVDEKREPVQKPLELVRLEIATQLFVKEKASALAKDEVTKALVELKKGKALAELFPAAAPAEGEKMNFAAETKPEAKETGEFNASVDAVPQLGPAPEVLRKVFDRTTPGLIDEALRVGDDQVLVSVTERKVPSDDDFAKQKETLRGEAIKAKQFEARDAYLKSLKAGAQIVQNDRIINEITDG